MDLSTQETIKRLTDEHGSGSLLVLLGRTCAGTAAATSVMRAGAAFKLWLLAVASVSSRASSGSPKASHQSPFEISSRGAAFFQPTAGASFHADGV